jgi:hypothetical protein
MTVIPMVIEQDARAARLAYYEARKLNNPPNSLLDYNDAKRVSSRQPSAAPANDATTAPQDRRGNQACRPSAKTRQRSVSPPS